MNPRPPVPNAAGAAALVVVLGLLLSTTLATLTVARSQLGESRASAQEQLSAHLARRAESLWQRASVRLRAPAPLAWQATDQGLVSESTLSGEDGIAAHIRYRRAAPDSPVVALETRTHFVDGPPGEARIRQTLRLLSALSPRGENAPPLVLNGCLTAGTPVDIRPRDSDSDNAGAALWQYGAGRCAPMAMLDTHGGEIRRLSFDTDTDTDADADADADAGAGSDMETGLWGQLFSLSREAYAELAAGELALAAGRRRHWLAQTRAGDVWRRSLGSAAAPVVLVFPDGCPRFGAGVRIVGVVYIAGGCQAPPGTLTLEVIGTLAVDGELRTGDAGLRLSHIQQIDPAAVRLRLPVLRTVAIPGSWRDF